MVEFKIKHKINGNDSVNKMYAGQHWSKRKATADYWHLITKQAIKKQTPRKMFEEPVMIEIEYNSNLDIDNHSAVSKMIIDSMKGLLLKDDTKQYVVALIQKFHSGDRAEIRVRVTEVSA